MAMKNKALTGGFIGALLLGAYFLSDLFNGFGLGPGSGTGTGTGTGENSDPSKVINSTEEPDPDTVPVSKAEPGGVERSRMVMVLIDGEEYKVLKSPEANIYDPANYRPATLEQIADMAKKVEGVQGLKVRIAMRETSTPQAEANLKNTLLEAGLPRTAFRELEETIP